jgi:endonuclease YncB( thermonuclease family)
MATPTPYSYFAIVRKVYDGDSATLDIDLGLDNWRHGVRVRLAGCNAIELDEPGGAEAREALLAYLPIGQKILVKSVHYDKYNRIDAELFALNHADEPLEGGNIIEQLLAKGYLVRWDGKGERPAPTWPRETPNS